MIAGALGSAYRRLNREKANVGSPELAKATLEGAAVLAGILVAFGIDAAWETRQEGQRVDAYLASLSDELLENTAQVQEHLERLRSTRALTERYLVELVGAPAGSVSQDSILAMVRDMAIPDERPLSRSAFDDLIAGGLQLVDDAAIRRLILSYGQALEFNDRRLAATEAWWDARFGPYDEAEADLVGMGSLYRGGWLGRTDLRFEMTPTAFVGNRQYANLLAARFFRLGMVTEVRTELLNKRFAPDAGAVRGCPP